MFTYNRKFGLWLFHLIKYLDWILLLTWLGLSLRSHQKCRYRPFLDRWKICSLIQDDFLVICFSLNDSLGSFKNLCPDSWISSQHLQNCFVVFPTTYLAIRVNHLTSFPFLWVWNLSDRSSSILLLHSLCCGFPLRLTLVSRLTFLRIPISSLFNIHLWVFYLSYLLFSL